MSSNESVEATNTVEHLRQKIEHVRIGMLTTVSSENSLVSRPMTSQKLDDDGSLWFFVSDESSTSHQIDARTDVNVSFSTPEDSLYVSIAGRAEIVKDKALIHSMWNPFVAAWFPNGPDDPMVALIKVDMQSAEYWDSKLSKMTQLWKMAKAAITGTPPTDVGNHGKVTL